jgi:lipoate-protein ligase A
MLFLIENQNLTVPSINLALEEYIVRNFDLKNDYLILYQNQPSIVIGKHQNVFEEVNTDILLEEKFPVYRRISGGGAVYHDLGNLNFCYITSYNKYKFNNYHYFTLPIIQTLNMLGLSVKLNKDNALVIKGKKISGNAQFTSKNRMMSHGTLLFSSNLENLRKSLAVKQKNIQSKSRKSIRREVINITDCILSSITLKEFRDLLVQNYFKSQQKILYYQLSDNDWMRIKSLIKNKYENWQWNYGESPEFHLIVSHKFSVGLRIIDLIIDRGRIVEVKIEGENLPEKNIKLITNKLNNIRYYHDDLLKFFNSIDIYPTFGNISVMELLNLIY